MASYCFLKGGENANICILESFPWARGCCVHVFLVTVLIMDNITHSQNVPLYILEKKRKLKWARDCCVHLFLFRNHAVVLKVGYASLFEAYDTSRRRTMIPQNYSKWPPLLRFRHVRSFAFFRKTKPFRRINCTYVVAR